VLSNCDRGLSTRAAATKYSVSASWVRRLKQRRRQTGEITPRAATGRKPSWPAYADRLRDAIAQTPDATLEELRDRLGLAVALSTLWRAVAALGLSVKKVTRAVEQDRPDVAAKRQQWRAAQPDWQPERLVFLDETRATTNMAQRYGRAPARLPGLSPVAAGQQREGKPAVARAPPSPAAAGSWAPPVRRRRHRPGRTNSPAIRKALSLAVGER
jgi:transposase